MFEPPVAASFTTAVRSNGLPETGLAGEVATPVTTGGATSAWATTTVMQLGLLVLPAASLPVTQKLCEPPLAKGGTWANTASFGSSNAPSCATITTAAPPSIVYVAPAMFEPPVSASFTTAVRSNGLPETGSAGDVAASVTAGGATSVSVAVKIANVSFAPVTLSTARASTRCGPEAPRVQRSWAMPSGPVIAAPANTLPPPETTTKLTICPFTAWARESTTSTTSGSGSSVPGGPVWLSPDTTDMESGPTGWSVSTTVLQEASTRSPAI